MSDEVIDKLMNVKKIDKITLYARRLCDTFEEYELERKRFCLQYSNDYDGQSQWNRHYPNGYADWAITKEFVPVLELQKLQDKVNEIIDLLMEVQRRI